MKIVFSTYDEIKNPYYGGGGAIASHEVVKRLAKTHNVTIVCGRYTGSTKKEVVDSVTYLRIGPAFLGPKIGQLFFHLFLIWHVMTLEYDVWIESFTPPLSGSFLPLFTHRPVIGCAYLLPGEAMANKYHLPFGIIEKISLYFYNYVIALTEHQKNKLLKVNKKLEVRVIPVGISSEMITQNVPNKEDYFLYLGRIDKFHKGLDLLLPAYKSIIDKTNVKLVMAGGGVPEDVQWFKSKINDLKLWDRVEYLGRVDTQKKISLLEKAMFLVFPSRHEGFGTVPLEAFATQNPIICFDVPDLNWIPKEYSNKIPPFDITKYANKILELIEDKPARDKIGLAAKNYVKNFDWDLLVQSYDKFINDVVKNEK